VRRLCGEVAGGAFGGGGFCFEGHDEVLVEIVGDFAEDAEGVAG
jgi:hypothetical protein